jgi:hypothetical protein
MVAKGRVVVLGLSLFEHVSEKPVLIRDGFQETVVQGEALEKMFRPA